MHDIMDRVTNISWRTTSGATLGGFQYEYDAAVRIVSRSHPIGVGDRLASYGRARSPSAPQSVIGSYTYDAWGNVVDEAIASNAVALATIRYRFECREWSAATGLVNFRMRWYDSETGRRLSKDPIGLRGGLNLYAFCDCRPAIEVDKYGKGIGCAAQCAVHELRHKAYWQLMNELDKQGEALEASRDKVANEFGWDSFECAYEEIKLELWQWLNGDGDLDRIVNGEERNGGSSGILSDVEKLIRIILRGFLNRGLMVDMATRKFVPERLRKVPCITSR